MKRLVHKSHRRQPSRGRIPTNILVGGDINGNVPTNIRGGNVVEHELLIAIKVGRGGEGKGEEGSGAGEKERGRSSPQY